MILYENDWNYKFGGRAVVHTNTENFSFIKMSLLLKQMNIKNNLFMLSLSQPELMNYDPHNLKDNSLELQSKIALECKINPWYYFREIVRIPIQGSKPSFFKLDRANMALIWCYYNNIDVFETIPRQLGKTVSTQGIMSHVLYFWGYNINTAMITNSRKLISENVDRLKSIRDTIPSYLVEKSSRYDTDNKEGLSHAAYKNKYMTYVIPESEYDADNVGRGMTTSSQHWDEFGYAKNNGIAYSVAVTATSTAVEQARLAGMPCSNIITTTAALLDSPSGRFAYDMVKKCVKFSDRLYDIADKDTLLKFLKKNSLNNMIYITYSFLQLGKTLAWLKETVTRANKTQDEIDTDYLLIWKQGAENSVVPSHLLEKIKQSELEPLHVEYEFKDDYEIRWYVSKFIRDSDEFKNKPLIMGLDSSENIGKDFSSFVIIDPSDMAIVGTVKCNETNIIRLGEYIARLLIEFKKMLFIPERKSSGATIIDVVILRLIEKGMNPYFRIFNQVIDKQNDKKFSNINIYQEPEGENRKYFGFSTGAENRNILYKNVLMKTLNMNHSRIYDSYLINEICQLTTRGGRIDHSTSSNDDTIFAYMLACYVIFFGNNLDKYGLNKTNMLTKISSDGESVDQMVLSEQDVIRNKIALLDRKIKNASSLLIKNSYERELRDLTARLDETIAPINVISKEQLVTSKQQSSPININNIRRYFGVRS